MPVHRAGEPHRVEPADQAGRPEDERVAYFLKVPAPLERTRLRQKVLALGARFHGQERLRQALRDGLTSILPDPDDPDRALHLATIDAQAAAAARVEAAVRELGLTTEEARERQGELPADYRAALEAFVLSSAELQAVEEVVRRHVPSFAELCADNETYFDYVGHAAVELLLIDWANVGPPFRRGPTGPPPELAALIQPHHLQEIGVAAQLLLAPTGRAAKNFGSPSPGGSSRTTSPTALSTPSPSRGARTRGASRKSASRASGSTRST